MGEGQGCEEVTVDFGVGEQGAALDRAALSCFSNAKERRLTGILIELMLVWRLECPVQPLD
jgi:hypothetical protein